MDKQLSNSDFPDQDYVLRYCSPKCVRDEKIAELAFHVPPEHCYISINWLGYFSNVDLFSGRVGKIREAVGKKLTLKENGRFAKLNVGEIKDRVSGSSVKHIPLDKDDSHSGIYVNGEQNRESTLELANMII